MSATCTNCGHKQDGGNFCSQCGAKIRDVCPECWMLHSQAKCSTSGCGKPTPVDS